MRLETLKRRAEFDRIRSGRKWVSEGFILQAMPRSDETSGGPRFGFAVASKTLTEKGAGASAKRAGAVLRNRAKRRLKEAVRLLAPEYARSGFDYVIIGRRGALRQRFADLLEDFQLAFGKVHRPARAGHGGDHPGNGRKTSAGEAQRETEGS